MAKQEGFKVRALSEAEASRLALTNGFQSIGFARQVRVHGLGEARRRLDRRQGGPPSIVTI
jgi:hypothetical protein